MLFDFITAPFAEGLFLGDYQALTSVGNTFVPFYVTTNHASPGNLADVFATLLTSSAVTPPSAQAARQALILHTMRAAGAPPLSMTPQLERALSDSARLTLKRRIPGRPPSADEPPSR